MIICCGEALIDMLPRELGGGEDVFLPVAGGAVFNTAIGLGRLGEDVGFVSGLSTDMFGDLLVEALAQSGVKSEYAARIDNPTTLAFVKLVDGNAQYSFFDENSAGRNLTPSAIPQLPKDIEAMHFGAISLIPEPCGSTYEALMVERSKSSVISLDPNIRPGFITDEDGHRARMERMIAHSDIIKVSDEDLEWLCPGEPASDVFAQWLKDGARVILLTRGSEGATAYLAGGEISVPVPKVAVVDTVGAGDTFNSGFLAGLKRSGLLDKQALCEASPEDIKPALELAKNRN